MKTSRQLAWILAAVMLCQPFVVSASAAADDPAGKTGEETRVARERDNAGETDKDEGEAYPKRRFFRDFWQDEKRIWTSPFRAKPKDLLLWGGLLALTGVMIHNDEAIYREVKEFQAEHEWVDKATPFFSDMAQGYPFALAGAIWITGALTRNEHAKETGYLSLQAMLHSFVVVQMVKHLTGRARPSAFDGQDSWAGPAGFFKRYEEGKWSHYDAMFSGHTITLWSLATVLAHQYRKTVIVPVLAYSLATLGGLATITDDLHWLSDVVLGAAVGYAIARFVIKRRSKRFQVSPVVYRGGMGIGVRFVF